MTPVLTTQDIKAGVPKPDNAGIPYRVRAKTERNLRNGPATQYLDQGKPGVAEIKKGNELIIFDNTMHVAADSGIWKWVEIQTGDYAGRGGWIQITGFEFDKLATQPIPPIAPEAPQTAPASAPQSETTPASMVTPEPTKTPKTREIRILITASDEEVAELTAAALAVGAAFTEMCKSWGLFREASPVIEVKEGV